MKTTKRYDKAVNQLYNAFNKGTLNAFSCKACAVGNMVGHGRWKINTIFQGNIVRLKDTSIFFLPPEHDDYTVKELDKIEYIFLSNFDLVNKNGSNKESQFKGLMAVIEYLAELDGIKSISEQYEAFKEVLERETVPIM